MIDRVERPPWMERETAGEKVAKFVVLALITVLVIYPFITVVATSLATQEEITRKGADTSIAVLNPSLAMTRTRELPGAVWLALPGRKTSFA